MTEIYNLGLSPHERYAHDQKLIEEFRSQYHVLPTQTRMVAGKAKILDLVPKHPALELLMQTYQRKSWAQFTVPQNFYIQSYASQFIAPSLGNTEKQQADINRIFAIMERQEKEKGEGEKKQEEPPKEEGDDEEEREGGILVQLLQMVSNTNEMIDYVASRVNQFLQG